MAPDISNDVISTLIYNKTKGIVNVRYTDKIRELRHHCSWVRRFLRKPIEGFLSLCWVLTRME